MEIVSLNNPIHRSSFRRVLALVALAAALWPRVAAQPIYLPTDNEIYPFLKRMEARHLLEGYRDAAKPLSRLMLAKQLKQLEAQKDRMTRVERDEFEFLKTEFQYELLKLAGDAEPTETRWHVISTPVKGGVLNLDVDFKLAHTRTDSGSASLRAQGIRLYGYAFDDVGFYVNVVDNRETGPGVNLTRANSAAPGIVPSRQYPGVLEYNDADVQFTFRVGAFDFSLEKMKNVWGFGEHGTVIFSDKAPSYPQVKMRVNLTDDIDFIYFHGELNSNVVDSVRSYYTSYPNSAYSAFREVDHSKYIAAHMIEFSVARGVDLSLGESIVYSDRGPLLMYMIPVMFFKAGEWYNRDKDNSQIFGSLDVTALRNVDFYTSLFIDELNSDAILDPNKSRRQVAFTLGAHTYDLLLNNVEFLAEYSRGNPWVYNHKYTAANFTNNGYDLGDWIGQNADDLYLEASLRPMRGLKLSGFSEVYRKGGKADISNEYKPDGGDLPFLYGPLHVERTFGIGGTFEPVRDVFLDARLWYRSLEDEQYPMQNHGYRPEFTISAGVALR